MVRPRYCTGTDPNLSHRPLNEPIDWVCSSAAMQWNALHHDSPFFPPSTTPSTRQRPIEFQPTASTHQLQRQQEQGSHYIQQNAQRGDALQAQQDQRPLPLHAPATELSFAQLPRHSAVLRQQLLRLRDEVALLQVLSHDSQHSYSIHCFSVCPVKTFCSSCRRRP